jgi:hypothetical protein
MPITRRTFLGAVPAALAAQSAGLDRRAIVSRHNPVLRAFDPRSPLSVGNGEFCFTADCTGLQTLPRLYQNAMPLCTMAQWGWHTSLPKPPGALRLTDYDTYGRTVSYPTSSTGQAPLFNWLRENPHRANLFRIGFAIDKPEEIKAIEQTLDLWTGILHSEFEWQGRRIQVETSCHPTVDQIAFRVHGAPIPLVIAFPDESADPASIHDGVTRLDRDGYSVVISADSQRGVSVYAGRASAPSPRLKRPSRLPPDTGPNSGPPARPLTSPPIPSSSAASSFRSTSPPSSAPARFRRRRPGSRATRGSASFTSRCTSGTPRTSPTGSAPPCFSEVSTTTPESSPAPARRRAARDTKARAGRR